MKAKFLLDGQEVTPNNYEELSIELNFDKDNPVATVGVNEWELGVGRKTLNDGANLANIHIADGLNNGRGVFEGKTFQIYVRNQLLFNGYLDLSQALIECNRVIAPAIEAGNIDWLNDIADKITFDNITAPYYSIPYVISEVPDVKNSILTILTISSVTIQLSDQLQTLIEHVAGAANPFQGVDGVKALLRIIYIVGLVITLITLLRQLFNLIIQPIKYHLCSNINELCKAAASSIGKSFESSILNGVYKDAYILPEKRNNEENEDKDGVFGFLNPNTSNSFGFYKGSFGDLLRELKKMFNAKVIIDGDIIKLERIDNSNTNSIYQIPPIDQPQYTLNFEDYKGIYKIRFDIDENDKNTIQEYEGTELIVKTIPKTQITTKTILGSEENININFCLGKAKKKLTIPEELFRKFFKALDKLLGAISKVINTAIKVVNAIIKIVNKIKKALKAIGIKWNINLKPIKPVKFESLEDLITDRIGMLKMENDFVLKNKILLIQNKTEARQRKLSNTNQSTLNADYLWNNYHFLNSFDSESFTSNNQYKRKAINNVPFCYEDYIKVKNNNIILDSDGKRGLIESLTWNPIKEIAEIRYRINEVYTKNLKTEKLIPNGR